MSGALNSPQSNVPGSIGIQNSSLGSSLERLLLCEELTPGSDVSYQMAKVIYSHHPLGAKLADTPIKLAMSQKRDITIARAPDAVVTAYDEAWNHIEADKHILNAMRLSRIYGVATVVSGIKGLPTNEPIPREQFADENLYFNVLDPLNTSGSLVLNQDPNSFDFQKYNIVTVSGQTYHQSRVCVVMNEQPIYIQYTTTAFGYVGRSVYQRCLFPLKSFIQTMLTDDMVSQKAGVIVAKIKPSGSIADRLMAGFTQLKRQLLQGSRNYNVLSIHPEESIESLNLQNLDGAATMARSNILKNVAIAADMPGKLLANEAFVEGFSEGTEDAKNVAHYIDGIRGEMLPLFKFFDNVAQQRAWTPEFFATMQQEYPAAYGGMNYNTAFYEWRNSFVANWPSLLTEPESDKIKVDEIKLKATKDALETLLPMLDPENTVRAVQWFASNMNGNEQLFKTPLVIDSEQLLDFIVERTQQTQLASAAPASDPNAAAQAGGDGAPATPGAGQTPQAVAPPKKAGVTPEEID